MIAPLLTFAVSTEDDFELYTDFEAARAHVRRLIDQAPEPRTNMLRDLSKMDRWFHGYHVFYSRHNKWISLSVRPVWNAMATDDEKEAWLKTRNGPTLTKPYSRKKPKVEDPPIVPLSSLDLLSAKQEMD